MSGEISVEQALEALRLAAQPAEEADAAFRVLNLVAGRLGLDVAGYPAETPMRMLLGAVGDWAAGTRWRERPGRVPDEFGDVEPDYQAARTREWVWVSPGDRDEPGSWALGRTATGVGVHVTPGRDGEPRDVQDPDRLAAAIMSALRRNGPTPGDAS